jgi:5-amino-6-(5-phospho-D-ribitylamino)uracil phosphatase
MIKTVIFDMGGVIITLDENEAGKRFIELGMKEFAEKMDPYKQVGLNGQLEEGKISEEEYRREVCKKIGREVTFEELQHCWLGYMKEIPERNLVTLRNLKKQGYRVILLSNTNPYVSAWVDSEAFSGDGHPIGDYFDAMYRSYEVKYMKPDENFFRYVLSQEQIMPEECLFIDDGPRNCCSASELGLFTLVFPKHYLLVELCKRLTWQAMPSFLLNHCIIYLIFATAKVHFLLQSTK